MSPTSSTLTSSLCQKFDEMKSFRCQEIGYYPLLPIGKNMPQNRLILKHWVPFLVQACMDIYQREPGVSIYMFVFGYKGKDSKVRDASKYSFYFWADRRTNGNVEATLRKVRASAFSFWNSIFIRQPPPSKLISQAALKIQSHQAFLSWSRGLTAKLPLTDASKTSKTSQRQIFIKVTKEHTILCFHIFWGQNIPLRTWKP